MSFANIPAEMRVFPQWVLWRLEWQQGDPLRVRKPTKIPYAVRGGKASVTDPRSWASFEAVLACAPFLCGEPCAHDAPISQTSYSGIGFVFTKNDPFGGIDLDNVHGDKEAYERQLKVFNAFASYNEFSPSGQGLHIIVKATLPGRGRKRSSIEIYDNERFFTMTGNLHIPAPIEARQELFETLYNELGGPPETYSNAIDKPETQTDEEILEIARRAQNGIKFSALYDGKWQDYFGPQFGHSGIGQSEADFGLVDILAFYTENKNQIARIFYSSQLGERYKTGNTKHNARKIGYMIEKSFDRKLPPIDIDGLTIQFEKMLAERQASSGGESKSSEKLSPPAGAAIIPANDSAADKEAVERSPPASTDCEFPPGLVGEIAQFIYDAAPRPVRKIALAGAIGFMAGICGRAYNVSRTGLNQYVLIIAGTGRGKEAVAGGISKLVKAMCNVDKMQSIKDFVGPTEIASPQALLKWLTRTPCVYSIVGEFGLKLQEMSSRKANANTAGLKRVLLDLYAKSGNEDILGAMAYSKREDNTAVITSPAFTLIGESTPEKFFENINDGVVTDGLLPRFMVIEYQGKRVAKRDMGSKVEVELGLLERLLSLVAQCHSLTSRGESQNVPMTPEAKAIFDAFDSFCDAQINNESLSATIHELWNRCDLKAWKLGALYAVGENYVFPLITAAHAQRATDEIYSQTVALKTRFDNGEVGGGTTDEPPNEKKQIEFMVRVISQWCCNPWEVFAKKYRVTEEMWRQKIFPYNSLHMRLLGQTCFKNDRRGATAAIEKCYRQLLDNDDLCEIPRPQMEKQHKTKCRAFAVSNPDRFLEVR